MQDAFDFDSAEDGRDAASRTPPEAAAAGGPARALTLEQALDAAAGVVPGGHRASIVTVNRRLARHLTDAFVRRRVAAGAAWWDTPAILPLGSWLESLHDAAIANGASDRARLAPLAARRRWRAIVAERHAMLLDVDGAAREAARAWRLAQLWRCPPDAQAYLSPDAHVFRGWADAYGASLDRDRLVDEATLLAHVQSLIDTDALAPPSAVILAGFLDPPPALVSIMRTLSAADIEVGTIADGPTLAEPQRTLWPDDATELRAVADAAYRALHTDSDALLGVVVPDLDARRGEVRRAFDRRFFPGLSPAAIETLERPYDVSVGEALSEAPVVRVALLTLRLCWQGIDRQSLSTVLLSPYLAAASHEARARERLERKLREWRVRRLDLSGLRRRLDEASELQPALATLGKRIGAERRDGRESVPLGGWADRFSAALAAFGWPGEGLGSEEYQAVQALHGVLDDLQSLDDGRDVSAAEALADLRRLARERLFQPETPSVPIRLLGRLESHGQRFDTLWVLGLDSRRWPAAGSPTPFLSVADQREVGMPEASAEARLALGMKELEHWCRAAPAVFLSAALERDGQPLVPSVALLGAERRELDETCLDPVLGVRDAASLERIDDAVAPAVASGEALRGGAALFKDQAECPFRAFARHRLGLRALEEVDIGLDPRQSGTTLHRALELFWRETVDHEALMALSLDALQERVQRSVAAAFEEQPYLDAEVATLERRRVRALMHEWLEGHEMNREPFRVEAFERSVELEHGGIAVNLTIDRIDRIGDRRVVIDYKSGRNDSIAGWAEPRIANPQLPLYALANEAIDGVAFARVARGGSRFLGVAADDGLLPGVGTGPDGDDLPSDWDGWRARWRRALDEIAGEVAEGVAGVTPQPGACRYCELGSVCRYASSDPESESMDDADGTATS